MKGMMEMMTYQVSMKDGVDDLSGKPDGYDGADDFTGKFVV